ncbi:NAD-dependent epimerase/dehydratase family protein [Tropicimonas aquimaris]|uniref:NAD-dependent epimerase/dehydratase family protein n=1 Tax=Tropicimonas aquimaris TaxID=914152 RepID=A0ABW3IX34_9RHOB
MEPLTIPPKYQSLRGCRILVTGAAGFIGGALLHRLAGYGLDVTGTTWHAPEAEALRAEGLKAEVLDLASDAPFEPHVADIDIVFNIAAMFQETEFDEAMYQKVNADGALKLCQAAAAAGVTRFVQCSTVGVHGHVQEIPCKETSPFNPMDGYHRTKLAGELAILDFARGLPEDGMVVTVDRPAMVYGPTDTRMLKLFKRVLDGKFVMIGDGKTLAHLGFIDDQVDSFLDCAVAPRDQVHCEVFNIASDDPIMLDDLVQMIAEYGGVSVPKWKIPVAPLWAAGWLCEALWAPFGSRPPLSRRRIGFFTHNRAFDLTKARQKLGYVSKWDHRAGVARTIDWYRAEGLI